MPSQLARRPSVAPPCGGLLHAARVLLAVTIVLLMAMLAGCVSPHPIVDFTFESGEPATSEAVAGLGDAAPFGLAAVVTKVVDGDTIIVQIGDQLETVRLLGIDTPEKSGGPRPAECFGAEASARLTELLPPQTPILLTRDTESRDQ